MPREPATAAKNPPPAPSSSASASASPLPSEGERAAIAPHVIVVNYQAHLPAFEASFGAGECLRVVPGVGDDVQIVPGPHGGIDAYLNLGAHGQASSRPSPEHLRELLLRGDTRTRTRPL